MLEYVKERATELFLRRFQERVAGLDTVKVQCIGPATLILSGYSEDEAISRAYQHITAILDDLRVRQVISSWTSRLWARWASTTSGCGRLSSRASPSTPESTSAANMNWDDLFRSSVEIISFDASQYDITKYPAYRNGKRIAWGIQSRENVKDFRDGDLLTLPCGHGPKVYTPADCDGSLKKLQKVAGDLKVEAPA